jgi:hypothetical protein
MNGCGNHRVEKISLSRELRRSGCAILMASENATTTQWQTPDSLPNAPASDSDAVVGCPMPLGFPLHGFREHARHKDAPGIHAVAGFYPTAIAGSVPTSRDLDAQSSWHPSTPTPSGGKPQTACQTRPRATAMPWWGVQCPWVFLCTAFVNMHATRVRAETPRSTPFTIHHSKFTIQKGRHLLPYVAITSSS